MATTITPTASGNDIATASTVASKNQAGAADRFLKLLVAQMQNQDPLKPMDNAQVTSQMAQIQTVSGIEKLNKNIEGMAGQFSNLQSMQGAALVGRNVMLEGSELMLDEEGMAGGGFDLEASADRVRVDVLSGAGQVLDSIELGAQGAGRHNFVWSLPEGMDANRVASFRVHATAGATALKPTLLMQDRVESVITGGPTLMLDLLGKGPVPYSQIKSFN